MSRKGLKCCKNQELLLKKQWGGWRTFICKTCETVYVATPKYGFLQLDDLFHKDIVLWQEIYIEGGIY